MPGATVGLACGRPDHRRTAEAARLRHRPVRQEPSRRSRRISADRARVRRILRQSLSPQRRGRAGTAGLSQGSGIQEEVRTARRAPLPGRRQGRADDHGHRSADQEAHGNHRRGDHRGRSRLDGEAGQGGAAILPLVQFDRHAFPDPPRRQEPRQERAGRLQRSDGHPRRAGRRVAQEARRAGHRRQHHRHVFHRQRPRERHLAGWRQHAVPRPEGHQLGRRAGAFRRSCAGRARSSPVRSSTASARTSTCSRPCWPPPAIRT